MQEVRNFKRLSCLPLLTVCYSADPGWWCHWYDMLFERQEKVKRQLRIILPATVLLSTKLRKVTKVTDSDRKNLFPIFLSSWGDFKSKAKVKTKFPENFGALYPSENGPLGERLLNVTMRLSCLDLYVICDVVAHDWIHWIKLALRHFGKFWDPFSQWRCKISIFPKCCQLVLSKHYYSRHQSYHMIIWKNWSGGFTLSKVVHFVPVK